MLRLSKKTNMNRTGSNPVSLFELDYISLSCFFKRFCLILIIAIIGFPASLKAKDSAGALHKAAIPAFPGAEGAGAYTRGGRGGRILEVTSLDDSGP